MPARILGRGRSPCPSSGDEFVHPALATGGSRRSVEDCRSDGWRSGGLSSTGLDLSIEPRGAEAATEASPWHAGGRRDLEALAVRVWNPDVRPFVDEALRCHDAGAQRVAVVATWGAVVIDLVEKIERLAPEGSDTAAVAAKRVDQSVALGGTPTAMQFVRCRRSSPSC